MKKLLVLAALSLPLLAACAGTQVKRVATNTVIDLSGRWNDTDARLTAKQMVAECLSKPWLAQAEPDDSMQPPTVIIGPIRNKTDEHIDTGVITNALQMELINSGKVRFVASSKERGAVRAERLDQDTNASAATRKAMGQEIGADYMLDGSISSVRDREGGKSVVLYQVDLKLVNMKTNQIAWIGQKRIKKFIKRASSRW